jgi:hypothetical protein
MTVFNGALSLLGEKLTMPRDKHVGTLLKHERT